jgi:hypothetical protein
LIIAFDWYIDIIDAIIISLRAIADYFDIILSFHAIAFWYAIISLTHGHATPWAFIQIAEL